MAVHTVTLNPFNNFTLVNGDEYNFVGPATANYVVNILNRSGNDLAVSNANTVSPSDPASYIIPSGATQAGDVAYNVSIFGPRGIWVAGNGPISVALLST